MKTFVIGLVIVSAFAVAARAYDFDDNETQGWVGPKGEALRAGWPRDGAGRLIYGRVVLDCTVSADGHAYDCHAKSSEPTNPELEKAALGLAPLYTSKDKSMTRRTLIMSVTLDTSPDWLRKPTFDQMMAVFPAKAGGRGGKAQISCIVKTDGLLRACKIAKESPEGLGFGAATLLLAPSFLMKPALREGEPVESEVSIPVTFVGSGTTSPSGPSVRVVTTPPWNKTPAISDILAELDKKVGDKFADGKVVFQCTVSKKTGHLSDCITINTSPGMAGFQLAARSLTTKFEVNKEALGQVKEEVRVNLAFSFPDMQSTAWSKRYLGHPVWLQTVSPNPNQPLFPDEAAKAGLKTGLATEDCVLAPNGALTKCETVSESDPGVGFGEMAKIIAQTFMANPWTEDGLPADGAHVRLPIRMNYNPQADEPPPPTPTPATKP